MSKKILGILVGLPVFVILLWVGLYQFGLHFVEARLFEGIETLRKRGYTVQYKSLTTSKNPFLLSVTLDNPTIKDPHNLYQLTGPQIVISAYPWSYRIITVTLEGTHRLELPSFTNTHLAQSQLTGAQCTFTLNSSHKANTALLKINRLDLMAGTAPLPLSFHDIDVDLQGLSEPLLSQGHIQFKALGVDDILHISQHDHPFTFDMTYSLQGVPHRTKARSLKEWRDERGSFKVHNLRASWGTLEINANGILALDDRMKPTGEMGATIVGYDDALSIMGTAAYIKPKDAQAASFALNLLGGENAQGRKQITIPLTLEDGRLFLGPVKLLKFEALE
jgi:hypothetical protein